MTFLNSLLTAKKGGMRSAVETGPGREGEKKKGKKKLAQGEAYYSLWEKTAKRSG